MNQNAERMGNFAPTEILAHKIGNFQFVLPGTAHTASVHVASYLLAKPHKLNQPFCSQAHIS